MTNYQGNSNKSKQGGPPKEEKKIERITSDEVRIQKRGPWLKFKSIVLEIDVPGLINFAIHEHVIPKSRNMIYDIIVGGAGRTIYRNNYRHDPGHRPPPSTALGAGRRGVINYEPRGISSGYDPRPAPQVANSRVGALDARGYVISNREEAQQTLEMLATVIDRYEVVTVADLHEMLGYSVNAIDHRWGWIDVRDGQIRQVRDGWILELPQPEEIPSH